jgi:hypothetical protein
MLGVIVLGSLLGGAARWSLPLLDRFRLLLLLVLVVRCWLGGGRRLSKEDAARSSSESESLRMNESEAFLDLLVEVAVVKVVVKVGEEGVEA